MAPSDTTVTLVIADDQAGQRLDRALAVAAESAGLALSRSRLTALLADGAVACDGPAPKRTDKAEAGAAYTLRVPEPAPAEPEAEDIPLDVVHEDAHLIVVNKPAGMVVHPAPGAETGTLVNALLHHCGDSLAGIGGQRRPGIVHRIDKDTSGLLVVAKTDAAHHGLSKLFATHEIARRYVALAWGAPDRGDPRLAARAGVSFGTDGWVRIETELARHPTDRKRMAVTDTGGRRAVTHLHARERFGPAEKPFASLLDCALETGRTHQIRVHATHIGHALIGDPVYGVRRQLPSGLSGNDLGTAIETFARQALHAAILGFQHPVSGENLQFEADLPPDMNHLLSLLRRNA